MMTDQVGQVVWEAEYLPFGEPVSINEDVDGDGVMVVNNLRFQGQYQDQETGMHYNLARDYRTFIGRYMTVDPILSPIVSPTKSISVYNLSNPTRTTFIVNGLIEIPNALHPYQYALNNPLANTDPLGLSTSCQCASGKCPDCPGGIWSGVGISGFGIALGGGLTVSVSRITCWSNTDLSITIVTTCGLGGGAKEGRWGRLGAIGFGGEGVYCYGKCIENILGGSWGGFGTAGAGVAGFGGTAGINPSAACGSLGAGFGIGAGGGVVQCNTKKIGD